MVTIFGEAAFFYVCYSTQLSYMACTKEGLEPSTHSFRVKFRAISTAYRAIRRRYYVAMNTSIRFVIINLTIQRFIPSAQSFCAVEIIFGNFQKNWFIPCPPTATPS